jgi:microcystin-dependent protein
MRKITLFLTSILLVSWAVASEPLFRANYTIQGVNGADPSWRIWGTVDDPSPAGYGPLDVGTNDLIYVLSSVYGDVDEYEITNIVYAGGFSLTCDVVYAQGGSPRSGGPEAGNMIICAVSTNDVPFLPAQDYGTFAEPLHNGARNLAIDHLLLAGMSGYVPTNDAKYLAAMTNLVNLYGATGSASFAANTLTITHGTNVGGGAGNITNIISTDGSVGVANPGGPQPNLSATSAVAKWSGYTATQQISWVEYILTTNPADISTNLTLTSTNANPDVTGTYTQIADNVFGPVWTNASATWKNFYDSFYRVIGPNDCTASGPGTWTRVGTNPVGTYNPFSTGVTGTIEVACSIVTNSPQTLTTNTFTWLAGYNTNTLAWNVTRDSVEKFSTTNFATLTAFLNISNRVAVLETNAAPLQSYLATSNAFAIVKTNYYTLPNGVSVSGQVAILNTNTFPLQSGLAVSNDVAVIKTNYFPLQSGLNISNRVVVLETNTFPLQSGIAASNLAYVASTNAEAARVIATNAQTVANAALPKAGGTMSGPLTNTYGYYGNGAGLTNLVAPTATNSDALGNVAAVTWSASTNNLHVQIGTLNTSTNALNTRMGNAEASTNALNTRAGNLETATNAINAVANAALPASSTNALAVTALHITGLSGPGIVPVGASMIWWATNAPAGWFVMQGQAVSTNIYSNLYMSAVGSTFAISTTNMIIPDTRGRVIVGMGAGTGLTTRNLNESGGTETVILGIGQMPSHSHVIYYNEGAGDWSGSYHAGDNYKSTYTYWKNTENAGGGLSHSNMPPYLVGNYIIKY